MIFTQGCRNSQQKGILHFRHGRYLCKVATARTLVDLAGKRGICVVLNGSEVCCNCFQIWDGTTHFCPYCGYNPSTRDKKYPFSLPEGSVLAGRYLVGSVLGQGGFGITYAALDVKRHVKVAIKEFFPDNLVQRIGDRHTVAGRTSGLQQDFSYGKSQFLTEAKILAELNWHPNIVNVKSYFEENGTAYFVMQFLAGVSLQQYVRNQGGVIPWRMAEDILAPVMGALHVAHQIGIIHRDVTPDNIIITTAGEIKLLDFGAARFSLGDHSRSFDVILKVGYAPVEQYARHGRQGPYTDVYSVAATLYAVTTGYLPPEAIAREENVPLMMPSQYGAQISATEEKALQKALSIQAKDRFQTMEAFGKAILPRKEWHYFDLKRPGTPALNSKLQEPLMKESKPRQKKSFWDWFIKKGG